MTSTPPSLEQLPDPAIVLRATAPDWRSAIRVAAGAFEVSGMADESYGDRMIALVEEYGPYIVIAPGLAMAHARPGPDVHRAGMVLVTLAEPVAFGHAHNDPVSVVLGLAATEADQHVAAVAALANVFNDEALVPALAAATSKDEVRSLLGATAAG
ncbi:PTS sugar transporter subunit IIA [Herbiconiux sp. 11R-BC]|uniref:PTS sugar transporter subunit IIA n=1 Tax=Herbiconiux sp. 11R-BC TaxID=3111637 RepID=UPI003BFFA088